MNSKLYKGIMSVISLMAVVWMIFTAAVFNIHTETRIEKDYIPNDVDIKKSKYIQKGWSIWLKEGKKGYRNAAKTTTYFGKKYLKSKNIFETDVIEKPEKGLIIKGTSDKKHPITVPQTTYVHYVHNVEATAYDPSPESNGLDWAGITALGWRTRFGIAAVDPKVIALRSLIYVDGYGFAWTGDTGGDIKGNRIDLCYNTTEEALRYGRKKAKVYVLGRRPKSYYEKKSKK